MANIRNLAALAALGAAGAMAMRDRKDKAPVEDREKPKDKAETKPVAAAKEDAATITSNRDEAEAGLSGYTDPDRVANQLSAQQNKGFTTNARGEAVPMRRAAPKVAPVAAPSAPVAPAAVAPAQQKLNNLVDQIPKKKGGMIKKMASGGSVSARGDGIAQRGKTRGRFV